MTRALDPQLSFADLEFLNKERALESAKFSASAEANVEMGALTHLAHVMLNSNEFVYIH